MGNTDSILLSIKKLLGAPEYDDHYNQDILMHINSALSILAQIGVGPKGGFVVEDEYDTWTDFIGDTTLIESVKTYVYYRVKLMFDPPSTSFAIEAINQSIKELEWRLNVAVETPPPDCDEDDYLRKGRQTRYG